VICDYSQFYARQGRDADGERLLREALARMPGTPNCGTLNSAGRTDDGIKTLEASHARHPADRDTLFALVTINRNAGRNAAALSWADRLATIDPSAKALVDQLRQSAPSR
jgi:Flp pilus assembly protein TadD